MDNQPQTNQSSSGTPSWFSQVEVSALPPPKKSHKYLFIIVGVCIALLVIIGVILITIPQRTRCLTANDFKTLTDVTLADTSMSPTTNFYTGAIAFKKDSVEYDNTATEQVSGERLLLKIAQLYKSLDRTSIVVTIQGSYFTQDLYDTTQKQVDTVRNSLISAGMSQDSIQALAPTYVEPENEGDIPDGSTETTITITSISTCK